MRDAGRRGGARLVAATAAIALLLLVLVPAAPGAEDPAPAGPVFERRVAELRRAVAKPWTRLANWCWTKQLRGLSHDFDLRIVWLDPDNENSRTRLGHRRDGSAWKLPERAHPRVEDRWTRGIARLYREQRDKAYAEIAALNREFAYWCEGERMETEASSAWFECLKYAPADDEARRRLGYQALDCAWLSVRTRSREDREKWMKGEVRNAARAEGLDVTPRAGMTLSRWHIPDRPAIPSVYSKRYIVENAHGADEANGLLRACHTAERAVRLLQVIDGGAADALPPFRFIVVASKGHYEDLIVRARPGDEDRQRLIAGLGGFHPEADVYISRAAPEHARAVVVHKTGEHLASRSWGGDNPSWFHEAVACIAVEVLGEAGTTRCVGAATSAVRSDPLEFPDSWGPLLMRRLAEVKVHDFASLLRMKLDDMDDTALLQAWSFVWWARETDPALLPRLFKWLPSSRKTEDAVLNAFGCPLDAVQRAWFDWIREQWAPDSE